MINREKYLKNLIGFKDQNLIKVITGIRRCGKSTLFNLYIKYLKENGIQDSQIIHINLEDLEYSQMTNYLDFYNFIVSKLNPKLKNYVFLDEIQILDNFQKVCDSLYIKENVDLYITGSNAMLLSGELSTLLSGRYVEIKMLPYSFKEYVLATNEKELIMKYNDYITMGSFPQVVNLKSKEDVRMYLDGIYSSIVIKDISIRKNLAKTFVLDDVIKFMAHNIGNIVSSTKIANTMTSSGRKITVPTIENYLSSLTESYLLYKVSRYDIKGKQYLTTGSKYYLPDLGLRNYLLGSSGIDNGHILENVVYLELLRRGYDVYIGKVDDLEVDFIAINESGIEYYQVSYTVLDEKTLSRELKPLCSVNDYYPKYLITMDFTPDTSHNGIKQINAINWLLEDK